MFSHTRGYEVAASIPLTIVRRAQVVLLIVGVFGCATGSRIDIDGLRSQATMGSAEAQFRLGGIYEYGHGVPKSFSEALKWYQASAAQGYGLAQSTLGYLYMYGEGVDQDLPAALIWNRKAAEQGDPFGQHNLAIMYDEGMGIPANDQEAVAWYRKAAMQAYIPAWVNLGLCYWRGEGVVQDKVEAFAWLELARYSTTTSSDMRVKWTTRGNLDDLTKQMTRAEIKRGKDRTKQLSDEIFSGRSKN